MQVQRERELKFEVPTTWVLPDLAALTPPDGQLQTQVVHLSSTYYDTAERGLLSRGVTLRRRDGDHDTGWHLKVPDGAARTELRVDLEGHDEVPDELRELVVGLAAGAPLVMVARLDTERSAHRVLDAAGATLAEIADDHVTATVPGETAVIHQWREVEVELGSADEKYLDRMARRLRKSGAYPSEAASKLGRALEWQLVDRLPPESSLHALVDDYLDQQYRAIIDGDLGLRRGLAVVHPTRVATRRLRSVLRVFADEFEADRANRLGTELAWYAGLLGAVRDRQVLRTHLLDQVGALPPELVLGPVRTRIATTLAAQERTALDQLAEAMTGERYFALLADLRSWSDAPPFERDDRLARAVEGYVEHARRQLRKRRKAIAGARQPDEASHRARKAAKRARYTAELAEPVLGKPARRLVTKATAVQDRLGEVQDSIVVAAFLRGEGAAAGTTPGENGFTFGVLWAREQQRHDERSRGH